MKFLSKLKVLSALTLLMGIGFASQAQTYCTPTNTYSGSTIQTDPITNFKLNTINYSQGGSSPWPGYINTGKSTDLMEGQTYTAQINGGGGNNHTARIWIDYNNNGTFESSEIVTTLATINPGTVTSFPIFTVPAGVTGNRRLRLQYVYNNVPTDPCALGPWGVTHDYTVNIIASTPCSGTPIAGTLSSSANSVCPTTSFTLSTTGATADAGISYSWATSPAGANTWTTIAGQTGTSTTISSQSAATDYQFTVSCSNSGLNTSTKIAIGQKTNIECLSYCTPNPSCGSGDYINSFTLIGFNGTQISDLNTGCSSGGYSNRTNQSVDLNPGNTYSGTISSGYSNEAMRLWIDFNDNGTFESSESLTNQGGIGTGFSNFSITIPPNANPGSHRMRISLAYNQGDGSALNPCTTYTFGEVHDYSVSIFSPTGCVSPSNLLTSNLSQNGATVSWTASAYGDAASSYNYEIRTSGAAGSGGSGLITSGTVTNPTVNINGLIVSTNYTAYVQANCAGPAQSLWISKSFRTPKFVAVTVTGFNVDIIANGIGNASVSNNNDADAANSVFMAQDFQATGSSALPSLYLPNSRELANGDLKWKFADYSSNNALRLKATTSQTGTLTFSTPQKAKQVSVLAVLGSGGATSTNLNGTITFTDNSTQAFSNLQYRDWGTSMPNTVTSNVGSLNRTTNVINYDGRYISANTIQIDLANQNKEINKVDFTNAPTNGSSNVLSIMGISIEPVCDNPTVSLGNDTSFCFGNSLTLDAGNAGMSYLWSDNSTAQTLAVTTSGTYSVTVTDGACSTTDAIQITVNPTPSATSITGISYGSNAFTFQMNSPQNADSYTYDYGDGSATTTVTSNDIVSHQFPDAANYTVTVTMENANCSSEISVTTNMILPVEMDLLKAVLNEKNQAVLSWNTFSERNNKGFSIEQSTDGKSFGIIDFVSTKVENGNSSNKVSYQYTDLNVLKTDAYYRLIQTDLDGKTAYSNIVRLSVKEAANFEMIVHPNPVAQALTIQLKGNVGQSPMITITDILGKVVKSVPVTQMNMSLDMSSLISGIYFVKYNDEEQTKVLRLSKE